MAENYCSDTTNYIDQTTKYGYKHQQEKSFLLNELFDLYVKEYNVDKSQEKLERINDFLKKFAGNPNLDTARAISALPGEYQINQSGTGFDFFGFLEKTLIELEAREKKIKFENQIVEAQLNKVNADLSRHLKRNVIIQNNLKCLKCKKYIKEKHFKVYPNGVVVDIACSKGFDDTCPVTFQNFKKSNFI